MNRFLIVTIAGLVMLAAGCGDSVETDDLNHSDVAQNDIAVDVGNDTAVNDPGGTDTAEPDSTIPDAEQQDQTETDLTSADLPPEDNGNVELPPDDTGTQDTGTDSADDILTDVTQPQNIGINPAYSGCGGFDTQPKALEDDPDCGDEKLLWSVDGDTGVITFTNKDVWLNCCGIHDIKVTVEDGTYVITETDSPEVGGGRCNCMCLFDFAVDVPGSEVDADEIQVRIVRIVTDEGGTPQTVWEGDVDLSTGEGEVLIEENVGWCYEGQNIGTNPQYSNCGGFSTETRAAESSDCGTERLRWTINEQTEILTFTNLDVWLNCCGDHDIKVTLEDDVYVITETDSPAGGTGRCFCMCLFDFAVDIPKPADGTIQVRLNRLITEGEKNEIIWEGTIDLTAGDGEVVILENVGYCNAAADIGANARASGCGGFEPSREVESADCADELLTWSFDSVSGTVSFVNSGVWLNCCGDHSVNLYTDGSVYTIEEIDEPENGTDRCRCMCMFDYAIDLPGMVGSEIGLRLLRKITDDGMPHIIVWEGSIDLAAGSGTIVIAEDVGWCS